MTFPNDRGLPEHRQAIAPETIEALARALTKRLAPVVRRVTLLAHSEDALMTIAEVCDYLKVSRTQFYLLRRGQVQAAGKPLPPFPAPKLQATSLLWTRRDVDGWIESLPKARSIDWREGAGWERDPDG